MAWPSRADLWKTRLRDAQKAYADVAKAIARFEPLIMVANEKDEAEVRAACGLQVEIVFLPIDDSWLRDSGPTFVMNDAEEVAGIDWGFNAWGGKFPPWDRDAAFAGKVLERLGMRRFQAPFILEGGSIHVDGEGTVLTTEQCLLNPNRNPTLNKAQVEANLKDWLGVETVIWLGQGLENDHTDGHIDDIACFVRPGVVMAAVCDDPSDPNFVTLGDNLRRLKAARDAKGRALQIIEMPLPGRREVKGVGRLASTYINFYIANGGIVAPSFDDVRDSVAKRILSQAFPDRDVVMVPGLTIVEGGGCIHCITQQEPVGAVQQRYR
jgi:agmatine deiminase